MNIGYGAIALIAVIASLVGGFAGRSLQGASQEAQNTEAIVQAATESVPAPSDFVSARPAVTALPSQSIDAIEKADLLYMREEEKLARDVYTVLYETWNLPIFANIAQSEQTHTEAVRTVLDKYSIPDPVTNDAIGVFIDPTLQALYATLVEEGKSSREAALRVGAKIEDLDIYDLQVRTERTDNADITLVYENLSRGSRNHLRSFVQQITVLGGSYTPAYISSYAFTAIVTAPRETGAGGGGNGSRGWGNR